MKTKFDVKLIEKLIKDNKSFSEIKQIIKISHSQLWRIINKFNLPKTSHKRNSIVNIDYFETINTTDKAYFLGWLLADGNVRNSKGKKHVRISLSIKDKNILELFLIYLNSNIEIKNYKPTEASIYICSVKMVNDLIKLGVTPNKSNNHGYPILREDLIHHFIRGYFDGDGSIFYNKKDITDCGVSICGSQKFCEWLKENFQKIGVNSSLFYKSGIFTLIFSGRSQVKILHNYLYKDCGNLYLERKKQKFEKIEQYSTQYSLGENRPKAKLTNEIVKEIRGINRNINNITLSKLYNVSPSLIGIVKNNKLWKHVK